jgi:hypothetical protein
MRKERLCVCVGILANPSIPVVTAGAVADYSYRRLGKRLSEIFFLDSNSSATPVARSSPIPVAAHIPRADPVRPPIVRCGRDGG